MSDAGRPPTRAEKSAAWLACAGAVAGLAWTTDAAYARVVMEMAMATRDRTPLGAACLMWLTAVVLAIGATYIDAAMRLTTVALVAGWTALGAVAFAVGRIIPWLYWALTDDVAGKPKAGDGLDDEEGWR